MTPKIALWLTWAGIAGGLLGCYATWAQTGAPSQLQGCIVVGAAPTVTAGAFVGLTCNTSGQLRMSTTP